jgi:hypothetical protein
MDRTGVAAGPEVLHEVRAACRRVLAEADHVAIDEGALADLAGRLRAAWTVERTDAGGPDPWVIAPDQGSAEERAGLVLTLAAINFGSGYHPHLRKEPGCSGATTMARALRRWAAAEPLTAARLAGVTAAEAHELFGQPPDGGPRSELMGHLADALAELGTYVADAHGGSFLDLVEAADGRAAGLVGILDRLPHFRDVAAHHGRPVPFYKRAQLAAADLDRAFAGREPWAAFGDLDDLTAFADNLVPHVLRVESVLRYDDDLAARIDAGEPLAAGSTEEVEIRAAGVEGVERLRAALAAAGRVVRASDLDQRLWRRGGAPRFKSVPRHRARSVFY